MRVYAPLNSISVISGQPEVDKKNLCAMDPRIAMGPRLRLERSPPPADLKDHSRHC